RDLEVIGGRGRGTVPRVGGHPWAGGGKPVEVGVVGGPVEFETSGARGRRVVRPGQVDLGGAGWRRCQVARRRQRRGGGSGYVRIVRGADRVIGVDLII